MHPVERQVRRVDAFRQRHDVLHSALKQFPIVGTDLRKNSTSIDNRSVIGIGIGGIGMLWGSLTLAENSIFTMMQV